MDRSLVIALASLALLTVLIISVSMWFPAIEQEERDVGEEILAGYSNGAMVRCASTPDDYVYFTAGSVKRTRAGQNFFEDKGKLYVLIPTTTCELIKE